MALNLNISKMSSALQAAELISPARFRRPLYSVGVYLGAGGAFRYWGRRAGGYSHG